ncbi:hypothetical protein RN001_005396 [Aquatica leii]|uniref:Angiotensin-converting enzyme n=1 Tax=Aquatica leii TaxID=1421715 RepID=A0AAN7SHU9_9COLE|nr:hypothetical protein RN001_005396 [Aquatica leii]
MDPEEFQRLLDIDVEDVASIPSDNESYASDFDANGEELDENFQHNNDLKPIPSILITFHVYLCAKGLHHSSVKMKTLKILVFVLNSISLLSKVYGSDPAIEEEEARARAFLKILNEKTWTRNNKGTIAAWNYASNITDYNLKEQIRVSAEIAKEVKEDWKELTKFNYNTFIDYDLRRQFKKYSILGKAALPDDKYVKLEKIVSDMESAYATAKICSYHNKTDCSLSLEPEITKILTSSRDPEELKHVWVEWRKKTKTVKPLFIDYVKYSNEAARLNNFTSNTEYWLYDYESPTFVDEIEKLWRQLKPLYLQLHAYVRHKLRQRYGEVVSEKGPIPAHLLGNMWAQTWGHVADFTLPYPKVKGPNYSNLLAKQEYTPIKMFQEAERFFVSLNLTEMPPLFWKNSILEKPKDGRDLVCHASAWDFYDQKDFRIKQCTDVTFEDFITAHHEMGHIQYYLQYKSQPVAYREGANDGFHEAVGDVMALSVATSKHLKKIGLIDSEPANKDQNDINELYQMGLDKIAFLPFAYLMDLWRWQVFDGKITPEEYNCKWWDYRYNIQGIEPPVDRSELDFDPASKYHIVADVPYLRYFISYVIQFQFHRAACEIAGEYDPNDLTKPLHKCDIYQNTKAGNAIGKMLQMGSSRPWREAMEALTGQQNMDASGLLEYFRPLYKWLETENQKNNVYIGWKICEKKCTKVPLQ